MRYKHTRIQWYLWESNRCRC